MSKMLESTLLPKTETEKLQSMDIALRSPIPELHPALLELSELYDFDRTSRRFLDALAKNFAIDVWQVDWDEETQRKMLVLGIQFKRLSGTEWTVQTIIDLFLPGEDKKSRATITQWFEDEPRLKRGTFRVNLPYSLKQGGLSRLGSLLDAYKSEHAHYVFVVHKIFRAAELLIFGFFGSKSFKKVACECPFQYKATSSLVFASLVKTRRVLLCQP